MASYKLLYSSSNQNCEKNLVLLDSHILIGIENYVKSGKANESFKLFLADWEQDLKNRALFLSAGILETCFDRSTQNFKPDRFKVLEPAIREFTKQACNSESTPESASLWLLNLVLPGYAAMLKFRTLVSQASKKKGQKALVLFEEYLKWMSNDLGFFLPYQIQIALDYFVMGSTTRNYIQRLLKPRGDGQDDVLQRTWSCAWDVLYLQMLADLDSGVIDGNYHQSVLATFDRGLIELETRLAVQSANEGDVSCYSFNLRPNTNKSRTDSEYLAFYEIAAKYASHATTQVEKMHNLLSASFEVQCAERDREIEKYKLLITKLEQEVLALQSK